MPKSKLTTILCVSFLIVFVFGCNKATDESEVSESVTQEQAEHTGEGEEVDERAEKVSHELDQGEHEGEGERGEHEGESRKGSEHAEGGEGEETGPRIEFGGTHDEVRKGSRLILTFDKESSAFLGTVENLTEKTLTGVRIEVHLSNGTELGPTEPVNIAPGKKADVNLSAEGETFEWWKAHAEVGISEH
ncbi:hypothetical protein ACFLRW_04025 [Acidobacteriota bacterium]